jgi:hypothetical protein
MAGTVSDRGDGERLHGRLSGTAKGPVSAGPGPVRNHHEAIHSDARMTNHNAFDDTSQSIARQKTKAAGGPPRTCEPVDNPRPRLDSARTGPGGVLVTPGSSAVEVTCGSARHPPGTCSLGQGSPPGSGPPRQAAGRKGHTVVGAVRGQVIRGGEERAG